jgi:hypothetical protein
MEVRLDDEDGLSYQLMQPLGAVGIPASRALGVAEAQGGRFYRTARTWLTRIVVSQDESLGYPTYRVSYATPQGLAAPAIDVLIDARSGDTDAPEFRLATARLRAEVALAGPVVLSGISAQWSSSSAPNRVTFGTEKPARLTYSYLRPDLPNDLRVVSVVYDTGGRSGTFVNTVSPRQRPLDAMVDIEAVFAAVERSGGADARASLARDWTANAATQTSTGTLLVSVSYLPVNAEAAATFTYEVATGAITRTR